MNLWTLLLLSAFGLCFGFSILNEQAKSRELLRRIAKELHELNLKK